MTDDMAEPNPGPGSDPGGAPVPWIRVESGLAGHVVDLLASAGIPSRLTEPAAAPGWTDISIAPAWQPRARAALDLVLPGLLASAGTAGADGATEPPAVPGEPTRAGQGLSARLVRRSDPGSPGPGRTGLEPELLDGRQAFSGRDPSPMPGPDGDDESGWADDDGDFVPPDPPPLPRGDTTSRLAWAGAVGGPLVMLLSLLLGLGGLITGAGVVAFIAGFAVLVARMDDRPRQDDGWDDGAVL